MICRIWRSDYLGARISDGNALLQTFVRQRSGPVSAYVRPQVQLRFPYEARSFRSTFCGKTAFRDEELDKALQDHPRVTKFQDK